MDMNKGRVTLFSANTTIEKQEELNTSPNTRLN